MSTVIGLFFVTILSTTTVVVPSDSILENYEIKSLRSECVEVFKHNGNVELRVHSNPIHYYEEGVYKKYDTSFFKDDSKYYSKSNQYQVNIDFEKKDKIDILYQNKGISINVNNIENSDIIVEEQLKNTINVAGIEVLNESNGIICNKSYDSIELVKQNTITLDLNNCYPIEQNGKLQFADYDNNIILSFDNQYIVDNNEMIIHPQKTNVSYVDNDTISITTIYEQNEINGYDIEYPIEVINNVEYVENTNACLIRDKYIIKNEENVVDGNIILAGTNPMTKIDENFNSYNDEYVGIIEIDVPRFPAEHITSASLKFKKSTVTTNSNRNPTIYLGRITNNISYDGINGNSNLIISPLASANGTLREYNLDITDLFLEGINSQNNLLLAIEGSSSGYASFHSSTVQGNGLCVSITGTSDILNSFFGNAPAYQANTSNYINCFGYILNKNEWINISENSLAKFCDFESSENHTHFGGVCLDNFKNETQEIVESKNFQIREIDKYDSIINSDERRIAVRCVENIGTKTLDYHFMMQHNDGRWSHKMGEGESILLSFGQTPDMDNVWGYKYNNLPSNLSQYNGTYIFSGDTMYFAIS